MKLQFYLIMTLTYPLRFLPYRAIHTLGNILGPIFYYLIPKFRKRTLSNLALAKIAPNHKTLRKIARRSFANLAITCLEYPRLAREKNIHNLVTCENPEIAASIINQGRGIVFFVGHQANWELLFLEAGPRMPGVAIGRPIKNPYLYSWIKALREKFGGAVIEPKNAIKEGLRTLKKGHFIGIVGDQGMPESPYSFPFFGVRAFTTPAPALLAHRTNSALITATIKRLKGKYIIHYSDPIYPDPAQPAQGEVKRLMSTCLNHLEASIRETPDQWLWQHNRWKQETPANVYYRFRKDPLLLILKDNSLDLHTFRKVYPRALLTILAPKDLPIPIDAEVITYTKPSDLYLNDYRFKLVFDLTDTLALKSHYKRLSAFEVLGTQDLKTLAAHRKPTNLNDTLTKALCRAP